mmetsp:Transcript_15213/g.39548  ORF Transcript_15213/g.39548 Transcript_15213/m.39548 type:complete len:363 (+) Transcript_15213:78-1166(+)
MLAAARLLRVACAGARPTALRFQPAPLGVARHHGRVHREQELRVRDAPLAARLGVREQGQPAQRAARPAVRRLREHVQHQREAERRLLRLGRGRVHRRAARARREPLDALQVEPARGHEHVELVVHGRGRVLGEDARAAELADARGEYLVACALVGQPDVQREVGAVGEGGVERLRNVRRGEHEHVRAVLERVELREHRVHHAHGVGRLRAVQRSGARGDQRLDLVDQHGDERLAVVHQLAHLGKDGTDELARLREPLGEERVRVQLDQVPRGEALGRAARELVRERAAQRRLARAGRSVEQQQPMARHQVGVDRGGGERERGACVREKALLHRRLEQQALPMAVERERRQCRLLPGHAVLL